MAKTVKKMETAYFDEYNCALLVLKRAGINLGKLHDEGAIVLDYCRFRHFKNKAGRVTDQIIFSKFGTTFGIPPLKSAIKKLLKLGVIVRDQAEYLQFSETKLQDFYLVGSPYSPSSDTE